MEFLDKSLAQTQQEQYMRQTADAAGGELTPSATAQLDPTMQVTDDLLAGKAGRKK